MKKSFLITIAFTLLISSSIFSQESAAKASDIFNNALEQAAKEEKNVFIMFHASWCGWCKRMDASMNDESMKDYFSRNYVVEHLVVMESPKNKNLENPGAQEMLEKNGGAKSGIPFWLIYDSKGNLLADSNMPKDEFVLKGSGSNLGCPASSEEVAGFLFKLKATSDLNDEELKAIELRFRQNDPSNK